VKCWVAVSVMTLLLAGCGTQEEGASSKEEPPGEETSAEAFPQSSASSQQDLSIGDTATFEYGDTVTVYSYNAPVQSNNEFIQPQPGNQFAAIEVEGCAGDVEVTGPTGNPQMAVNPFFFALQMPDNTRLQHSAPVVEPAFNATNLSAGDCVRGSITFEVSQDIAPVYVFFDSAQQPEKWAIE
jgi:hypothetical protein